MTVYQRVKGKLIEEGFCRLEAKAIIAICQAFGRAEPFRKYWDGEESLMPEAMREKFAQQVAAIARAYRQHFTSRKEPALENQ